MKNYILFLILFLLAGLSFSMMSCGGGTDTGGTGMLIADFDLEGEEYLADPDTPLERLAAIFSSRAAHALPDLSFNSNSFPFNVFTGDKPVQPGLEVLVVGPDQTFVAQGVISTTGQVVFSDIPTGYLRLNITGADGHTYQVPVQISENTTSRTRILIYREIHIGIHNDDVKVSSKTIHDNDGDGMNDDDFSYAMFGRPRNQSQGGVVHLHLNGVTRVDTNGDGNFEVDLTEADDDGVTSANGDGDEDNDGVPDGIDGDMDGDGIANSQDNDIDGDGIPNDSDPFPNGTSPEDDNVPPIHEDQEPFIGVFDVQQITDNDVTIWFKPAVDDNEPVTYNIYWSTTSPIDFATANKQMFTPLEKPAPDDLISDNVIGLNVGETYHFAVRAQDAAQPPNEDTNDLEFEITMEDID